MKQLAAKSINTINNLTEVLQQGVENYAAGAGMPEGYGEAMNYINETKVDEDEFLRYRITERFNQILRDIYADNSAKAQEQVPPIIADTNDMTAHMIDVLDMVKSGTAQIETPDDAVQLMIERMGVTEQDMIELCDWFLDDSECNDADDNGDDNIE